jgi:hypothetical protein
MVRTTIYLPDELHEKLREDAYKGKESMASIIVAAIEDFYEGVGQPIKKELRKIKEVPQADKIVKLANMPDPYKQGLTKKRGDMDGDNYL